MQSVTPAYDPLSRNLSSLHPVHLVDLELAHKWVGHVRPLRGRPRLPERVGDHNGQEHGDCQPTDHGTFTRDGLISY